MDLLFPFKPPSVAINAVKVQFNIFVGDFQTFNRQPRNISLLFRLAHFFNNFLDKLTAFNLELWLDLICWKGAGQTVLCKQIVENSSIWFQVKLNFLVL